jgi:hypothetical protein
MKALNTMILTLYIFVLGVEEYNIWFVACFC